MFLVKQLQCWIREKGDSNDKPNHNEEKEKKEKKEENKKNDDNLNKYCGRCFSFFTDNSLNYRQATIKNDKFIFCSIECYETWLKYPPHLMMLGKIN